MDLVFIRHGRSDHNVGGYFDTKSDSVSQLTTEGVEQVTRSAEELKELDINLRSIYSSPLLRCRQTSEILKNILGIKREIIIDFNLRELEMGTYEGTSIKDYPYGYYEHKLAHTYKGETLSDVELRMRYFIYFLKENSLIVTHQAPIKVMSKYIIGEDIEVKCAGYLVMKDWKLVEPQIDLNWETYKRISKQV
jgi:broad specificity phosphatase PhoE